MEDNHPKKDTPQHKKHKKKNKHNKNQKNNQNQPQYSNKKLQTLTTKTTKKTIKNQKTMTINLKLNSYGHQIIHLTITNINKISSSSKKHNNMKVIQIVPN